MENEINTIIDSVVEKLKTENDTTKIYELSEALKELVTALGILKHYSKN